MNRFRNTVAPLLVGAALLAAVPFGLNAAAPAAAAEAEKKKTAASDTELAKQMEIIDEGMKKLRRSLRQPEQNAESLEMIGKMQAATVASKGMVPVMAKGINNEAERAKFVAAYRKDMAAMLAEIAQLEIALLDGDNKKAQELHKSLSDREDSGHEKFTQ
jgi:hypothetical protein